MRPSFPSAVSAFRRISNLCINGRPKTLQKSFPPQARRLAHNPADNPEFTSIVDSPAEIVRSGRRHGPGLIILAVIPITAFALGTWQVKRLSWKTDLIAKFEDRLIKEPLALPPKIDISAIEEFDYRRVYTTGTFRHDQEMLIGPRMRDGKEGYLVITPLERGGKDSTVLVNRGWISKEHAEQASRPESIRGGTVTIYGMLRDKYKKNMFTPDNNPAAGKFYFPDVDQMAAFTGSQPVWIEETMEPNLLASYDRIAKGIPVCDPAQVKLRNNHTQYIFTWYALSAATSVMLWMVIRKPPSEVARRVRQNRQW